MDTPNPSTKTDFEHGKRVRPFGTPKEKKTFSIKKASQSTITLDPILDQEPRSLTKKIGIKKTHISERYKKTKRQILRAFGFRVLRCIWVHIFWIMVG